MACAEIGSQTRSFSLVSCFWKFQIRLFDSPPIMEGTGYELFLSILVCVSLCPSLSLSLSLSFCFRSLRLTPLQGPSHCWQSADSKASTQDKVSFSSLQRFCCSDPIPVRLGHS
mmetsp:Transcript_67151/g.140272  ORF Transcript_67151/g.140272 Transcript_67151/m.140272 type:complete len:114 (+) Transcript_67151:135-476(+)